MPDRDGVEGARSRALFNDALVVRVARRFPDHQVEAGWLDNAYDTDSVLFDDSPVVTAIREEVAALLIDEDDWLIEV